MSKQIVILQRGWVVAGETTPLNSSAGSPVVEITDAVVIRRWGTTKGLGELALTGPTDNTVLDPAGTVSAHELAIVATIDIQHPENWQWPQQ